MLPRLLIAFLLLLAAPAWAAPANPPAAAPAFDIPARSAILIDAKSGYVFFEKDSDKPIPPASMAKLMTQAYVFDLIKRGDVKLDQLMVVSPNAVKIGGAAGGSSTMFANPNSQVAVDDLLHGAIIQSANDACIALAENIATSELVFAQRLNVRAKELGLTNSSFANSTGLPDPAERMSVRDLGILARYIIDTYPEFYKIYGQREFTWNKITQPNRNPLLKDYDGADGMKTGYTKESGYSLVGSAERDGRRLIIVVAGLDSVSARQQAAQKLLDYGFAQFKPIRVYEPGDVVVKARVWGGDTPWVDLVAPQGFDTALAPFEQNKADISVSYSRPLMAPVKAGTPQGVIRLKVDGQVMAEAKLETATDVPATTSMWHKALDTALIALFGG
ncbi:D-alanyl-D-alanine carboxypeptidase family protein [Aestuariivirga litoralis]|uniref:D-alanyl-D-alanine carboxypeptidase family protein n=1 Tax=Aestuariivirga litoralis TaxID=2650924 RepID=UPI0018C7BAAF|nr:D-alanyl-D-alanine carboxypeptidase family protein [Aestuariivirga litoralis]